MKRPAGAWVVAFGVLLAPALLLGMGVAVVGATNRCPDIAPDAASYDAGGASSATGLRPTGAQEGTLGLTTTQWSRASAIVATGQAMRVPAQAIMIALAVARQESGFKNYANDGRGGDLASEQVDVARSLGLPHDAVGTDHGSVGLFQQQWPWWGSLTELMTPATAAGKFYQALLEVPGWQSMPLTVAAQRVQRSAYPDAYADDADLARSILQQVAGTTPDAQTAASLADCADQAGPVTSGNVSWPVPERLGSTDRRNWGGRGAHWSSWHTGTDFSVPCGTPVLAAHAGTVQIDRTQPWAGPQLLKIATAPGRLTTWYAHMKTLTVRDGDAVRAGQPVGEVGEEGNSTGCHLHFEVHPTNGGIYEDGVNPSTWLRDNVRAGTALTDVSDQTSGDAFVLASFNALGHSHTERGGKAYGKKAQSGVRTGYLVQLLRSSNVSVAGLQEFEPTQHRALERLAPEYALHHPPGDYSNPIVYRKAEWSATGSTHVTVPYFHGKPRKMPVLGLRQKGSDRTIYVLNVHNPADVRGPAEQWRVTGEERELAELTDLERQGGQVFATGDFNDKADTYRRMTSSGVLKSAAGSPGWVGIDFILGSRYASFSNFQVKRGGLVEQASDHPFLTAVAR